MARKKKKSYLKKNWWKLLIAFLFILLLILAFVFKEFTIGILGGILNSSIISGIGGGDGDSSSNLGCTDSDDGKDYYKPGNVQFEDLGYYDNCIDSTLLKEYFCTSSGVESIEVACPLGYSCVQTRSGGYCQIKTTNSNGDILVQDSQNGASDSDYNNFEIDMGEVGSGNCELGVLLSTSWDYGNELCSGVQGPVGVKWSFYDSSGLVYTRTDAVPIGLGSDLGCGLVYDGVTPFLLTMQKTTYMPDCVIEYDWNVKIVACNCD